jgi:hypothetical protein
MNAMDKTANFQPGQILFLEYDDYLASIVDKSRLYVELIQVVVERHLCWVRPLMLVTFDEEPPLVTDLRDASDLLWSVNLFEPALDTEVITLFSPILAKERQQGFNATANQKLNRFIQKLWHFQLSRE